MKIHEYQAKTFLSGRGITVPRGGTASSPRQAGDLARKLGGKVVVKAQVLTGGRGKAGGIKMASSPREASAAARGILGTSLATAQSGREGQVVSKVLIEERVDLARELYLAITTDRSLATEIIIASQNGGVDIEDITAKDPEAIVREAAKPCVGLWPYQIRKIAAGLGLDGQSARDLGRLVDIMLACYRELDCDLLEINPLAVTTDGRLVALDAKINIEDNALFRQKKTREMAEEVGEDPTEREAARIGVSYIRMKGNIGCVVNGAGLAMTTMDLLKFLGGEAANFLDVGGGADSAKISGALKLILRDTSVRVILVNIFGGILRCDVFARGLLEAVKQSGAVVPLVIRLIGTNQQEGQKLLTDSGLPLIVSDDLETAAARAVAVARENVDEYSG